MFKNIAHGFKVLIVIAFSLSLFSNQIISVNAEENLAESISERDSKL